MPLFSIVIPAYNEEKYILPTLKSIEQQNMANYEVIVVANGCTDATEEIVKKKVNEKIRTLSLPKANVSVARNAGALNAAGEILVFLDADTQLATNTLQLITEQFQNGTSVATTKVNPDLPTLKYQLAMLVKNSYNYSGLYEGCSGILICRKKDFHAVGGYDPELVVREHRKLILKLMEKGKYDCLNTYVTTSMRRYQQWGLWKEVNFWLTKWWQDHFGDLKKSEYDKIR